MASAEEWDRRLMLLAHHVATWSTETGRHVGAVIAGQGNEVISTGHNGIPRGVRDNLPERTDKESGAMHIWSSHAERNAIFNAARIGIPLKGTKIYIPWFPCVNCTIAIIQSGISEVICYDPDLEESKWGEEFAISKQMLQESGVNVRYMEKLMELPSGEDGPKCVCACDCGCKD